MPVTVLEHLFVVAALLMPQPTEEGVEEWLVRIAEAAPQWTEAFQRLDAVSPSAAENWLFCCLEKTELFITYRGRIFVVPEVVS